MYNDIGDSELIYLIRSNNNEARDVLINRYKKRIFGIVHSFAMKYNLTNIDYEDFVSEGFIVFLKCIERYDDDYNFYSYVVESIERKLFKLIKKESLYLNISDLNDNFQDYDFPACDSQYPYKELEIKDMINENFDEYSKKIIEFKMQGYSFNEISKLMGISKKVMYKKSDSIKEILKKKAF